MKILIINGSPRNNSNSSHLIKEITKTFDDLEAQYEVINIGNKDIPGCRACGYCKSKGECVIKDLVNETNLKLKDADGLIVVSPVYYASPNGSVISFLDRLYQSHNFDMRFKVGAAFAIARRGGTTASFDVLNKYFTIAGMPVVSGDYWNNGFGREPGQIEKDLEGLRNARIVARRMVFLINAIKDAKEKYPDLLNEEPRVWTHFIDNK